MLRSIYELEYIGDTRNYIIFCTPLAKIFLFMHVYCIMYDINSIFFFFVPHPFIIILHGIEENHCMSRYHTGTFNIYHIVLMNVGQPTNIYIYIYTSNYLFYMCAAILDNNLVLSSQH